MSFTPVHSSLADVSAAVHAAEGDPVAALAR
jgi:hypothetical protein